MRILVLFAHPVETSYAAGLHDLVVRTLKGRGHLVDDCDLYAEKFDPVLSREERIAYNDLAVNRRNVGSYVDRVLGAEAIVFSFPVWNMGFPAILKGFLDRVFLPGVSFTLKDNGDYVPTLHNIKRLGVVCTYGSDRLLTYLVGDPPRRVLTRTISRHLRPRDAMRLSRPLRHESHAARAAQKVPGESRSEFLGLVRPPRQAALALRDPGSSAL